MKNITDVIVGCWFRKIRKMKGFNQVEVAEALGITFQQIQKYESGKNRISISRLSDAATFFGCSVIDLIPPELQNTGKPLLIDFPDHRFMQRYNNLTQEKRGLIMDLMEHMQ